MHYPTKIRKRHAPVRDLGRLDKRLFNPLRQLIRWRYYALDIKGAEHVPEDGPVIFVANHSGWLPLDALFLTLVLHEHTVLQELPYMVAHPLLFKIPLFYQLIQDVGVLPARWLHKPDRLPTEVKNYVVFPEGEAGNCKPFWQAYHMHEWKCSFVRMAIHLQAKVVPVAIVGAEESLPVAWTCHGLENLIHSVFPVPLSLLPLPSHWNVRFFKPLDFSSISRELAMSHRQYHAIASDIQAMVQSMLDLETEERPLAWLSRLFESF